MDLADANLTPRQESRITFIFVYGKTKMKVNKGRITKSPYRRTGTPFKSNVRFNEINVYRSLEILGQ